MSEPETIIASVLVGVGWLMLAGGLFKALKTGIDPASGNYPEAICGKNPIAYWMRVMSMAGGLVFFSILAAALFQHVTGVSK